VQHLGHADAVEDVDAEMRRPPLVQRAAPADSGKSTVFLLQAPGVAGEPGRLADRLLLPDDLKAHPGRPRRRTWSQGTYEAWPAASRAFQRIFGQRRLPRRLARRLNPRWQYRRWALRAARFDVRPAATPDGIAMITVMLHREDIGRLACQVCGTCRKALICRQSTGQEYQGPGPGRRALLAAPDHERTTTPQYDVSARFWQRMSRAAGASLTGDPAHGGPCPHMH
jgi:hypothetical protein